MQHQDETKFDWTLYADATLAGLSVLIPIPFLDGLTENFFRRRMAPAIARQHKRILTPETIAQINNDKQGFWARLGGCLLLPFTLTIGLLLQLSRKILYFLTVKKAVDALNYYWQRAFLLNHAIGAGHLSIEERVVSADSALETVLAANSTSPLIQLAQSIINSPRKLIRGVRQARKGNDTAVIDEKREEMSQSWNTFGAHFRNIRQQFDDALEQELAATLAPDSTNLSE